METVSKELAQQIIANEGQYKDDPQVYQVITYTNFYGQEAWAILYKQDVEANRYEESEYVRNPKVVWEFKG